MENYNEIENQLIQVDKGILAIKEDLNLIVQENKLDYYDAIDAGKAVLAKVAKNGMTDELDAEIAHYLKTVRQVVKTISDRRKPITQIFDLAKRGFTSMENALSAKTEDSVVAILTKKRDEYAQYKLEQQRKAEEERLRILRVKEERERLKCEVRRMCEDIYRMTLQNDLGNMNSIFSLMTLYNNEVVKEKLTEWPTDLQLEKQYKDLDPKYFTSELSDVDIANIVKETIASIKVELTDSFKERIIHMRDDLLSYYDSKVTELTEQKRLADEARRKAEEAQRIADEEAKRKAEEQAKRAEEEMIVREKAIQLAEERRKAEAEQYIIEEQKRRENEELMRKAQAEAESLFNQTGDVEHEKLKAKVSCRLKVVSGEAWYEIISLWLSNVAPAMLQSEVSRKLDFMRKDIEKLANKRNEIFSIKGAEWIEEIKAK